MSTCRTDDVLKRVRGLFELGVVSALTDGQLLDRFLAGEGGQAAFEALVERHGPMVLRVCRTVLGAPHDADDAFQATFLVLLRKAGSIRDRASCASWLHGVALRAAAEVRSATARRRSHERKAAESGPTLGSEQAPGADDLRRVIDEELGRLRDAYRSPLVLCYLEGHTCDEAARQLGWPVGTVKSRLARGRERLRARLTRRGVAPALALPLPAESFVAPSLAAKVASNGLSGSPVASAVAAAVVSQGRRSLIVRAALVFLGVGAVVGSAGLAVTGRNDEPPKNAAAAPPKNEVGPIHVKVVNGAGEAAPGAEVLRLAQGEWIRVATTDARGRGAIPVESVNEFPNGVLARQGEAIGWARVVSGRDRSHMLPAYRPPSGAEDDPVVLTLMPRTHRVRGSIVDPGGKPIAGVRVSAESITAPGDDLHHYYGMNMGNAADWPLGTAVSDGRGEFALALPEGVRALVAARHPGYVGPEIGVMPDSTVLGPARLEPAGQITGTVTDAGGAPVAGAGLSAQFLEFRERILRGGFTRTVSDVRGRFSLSGLEPGVYNVHFQRRKGRERETARAVESVRVVVGEPAVADIRVIDGRRLTGVAVDSMTDRPLGGILVGCYGPARPHSGAFVESSMTDEQGRFTFYVPPGLQDVYLMEGSHRESRLSRAGVDVPETGDVEPVMLIGAYQGVPGAHTTKKAASQDVYKTKAAAAPKVAAKRAGRAEAPAPAPPVPQGRTITGRVHDGKGQPQVGVLVRPDDSNAVAGGPRFSDMAVTDRDGVFVFNHFPLGAVPLTLTNHDGEVPSRIVSATVPADRDLLELVYEPGPPLRTRFTRVKPSDEPIPPDLKGRLTLLDLDPKGTEFVVDGPGGIGNDLARLPGGVHDLGGMFFRVGKKMIHLRGRLRAASMPASVMGIVAGVKADKVHVLHAAQVGSLDKNECAAYVVHYADGTIERIPVVNGRNVANWWKWPKAPDDTPPDARVAWEGFNDTTDMNPGVTVRLFATTWVNPHPEKAIATIDAVSTVTDNDPFLVGVTLERRAAE